MNFSLQKVFASFFLAGASCFLFFFGSDFCLHPLPENLQISKLQNFSCPFHTSESMFAKLMTQHIFLPWLHHFHSRMDGEDDAIFWCQLIIEKRTQLLLQIVEPNIRVANTNENGFHRMMRNCLVASQLLYPRKSCLFLLRKGQVWAALKQREVNSPLLSQIIKSGHERHVI